MSSSNSFPPANMKNNTPLHVFIILAAVFFTLYLRTFVQADEPLHFGPFPHLPSVSIQWPKVKDTPADLDKLAKAVSVAETGGCKDGTAINRRNCFGIMTWDAHGNRSPRYFKSQAESFAAFKAIWGNPHGRYKGRIPDLTLATIWSGADHSDTWLCHVHSVYFGIQIPDCQEYIKTL